MNKEQYKAHLRQRLNEQGFTDEEMRRNAEQVRNIRPEPTREQLDQKAIDYKKMDQHMEFFKASGSEDPYYLDSGKENEKGSASDRDVAWGIGSVEAGIKGSAARLGAMLGNWNTPKRSINDTSELIAAQAEKDNPGTHDQTYKDMEDVRIGAEKKLQKESFYKAYILQRLNEEL